MRLVSQIVTDPLAVLWLGLVGWSLAQLWRRRWRSVFPPLVIAAFLSLTGNPWLGHHLLARLEAPYVRTPGSLPAPADAVVMLGGQLQYSRHDLFAMDLDGACDRILAAADLARRGLGRALVLGGGAQGPPQAHLAESDLLAGWLAAWGLTNTPVLRLGQCLTTRDEAERVSRLAAEQGWKRLILVTSAAHMRRAAAVFRRLGLEVECVACDFQGLASLEATRRVLPFPSARGFAATGLFLHEVIGWCVYRWRGWV
jgi:uncharacterized SAM-binding protein YcdF (DUF218 family)